MIYQLTQKKEEEYEKMNTLSSARKKAKKNTKNFFNNLSLGSGKDWRVLLSVWAILSDQIPLENTLPPGNSAQESENKNSEFCCYFLAARGSSLKADSLGRQFCFENPEQSSLLFCHYPVFGRWNRAVNKRNCPWEAF